MFSAFLRKGESIGSQVMPGRRLKSWSLTNLDGYGVPGGGPATVQMKRFGGAPRAPYVSAGNPGA